MATILSKSLSIVPKSINLASDLVIEQLNESHAKELFTLTDNNRSYLRRWLRWLDACMKESDTLNFIIGTNEALSKNHRLTFGIFRKCRIAGTVSFNEIDWTERKAEIGYWIGETFQGFGLVTLACAKLLDIGFQQIDLQEIAISCALQNTKSRNIPIRLGFQETKVISKKENLYGSYVDYIIYTMQKDQWMQMQNK